MSKRGKLKIFLAVIILLVFLHLTNIIRPLENYFLSMIFPSQNSLIQRSSYYNKFFYYLFNYQKIIKENQDLKTEINKLTLDKTQFDLLKTENENLKKSLHYLESNNYQYLSAQIIGRSMMNPQKLILDKGRRDGISENLAVFYDQGVLLGKIQKVEEKISYLLLLTDNQSLLAAKVLNSNKTIGIVKGELGINTKLEMIPPNEELNVGDIIVTSGLEEYIPGGLLIGKIREIKQQPEALFKEAIINPYFDIRDLNFVTIILPNYE